LSIRYIRRLVEKTILDFIYIWRYNGVPREKIILDVSVNTGRYAVADPDFPWLNEGSRFAQGY
jgi:hypothetical protein